MPNTTNKIRTDLSTLTTCLPVHLNHANHQVGNNLPLRKITIIEDIVNKIHHNGKTGTTGANGRPPPVTTNLLVIQKSRPRSIYSPPALYLWDNTHFHSHHPAARLSAAPHSKPLTAFSGSAQPHHWSKKRHPRSDTGDHSRGASSLPAGHTQISLHDGNKTEWIKWVKFGLAHPERMKAASELPEEERPNASIDIEQFQDAVNFFEL